MFTPTGPFSRQTWRNIESLPGQALNALGQIGSYLGSPKAAQDYTNLLRGSVPGRVGSIPPSANGKSYRRAELELAEAARAGGGGGGGGNAGYSVTNFRPIGGTPAERAQAAETSRIAQLTAQDPELQRYEAARKLAVAPGATPEQVQSAEDIGMQIWAQKYGKTLAPKVKPGQAGYDVIQRTIGIQELPPLEKRAEFTWNQATQGPAAAGLVVDPLLNPAAPGFIGGEGPPPVNFADPRFENMSPEEFQKLLNQYTKR